MEHIEAVAVVNDADTPAVCASLSADYAARFFAFLDNKPKTIESYRRALRPFFNFLAARGIHRPTRADILAYRDSLKAEGKKATTIQAYIGVVRVFFVWLSQEGLYPNVAEHIKSAKVTRDFKKDYLTAEQVANVLASVDTTTLEGLRDYALILTAVTCGLRTIEMARADIDDIRTVQDFRALYVMGKGRDDKSEYVQLPPVAEEAVRAYLAARGPVKANAPLFASLSNNGKGTRLTTRAISGIFKAYLIKAGYNSARLTAHSFRHTAATLARLNGMSLEETQKYMRHSSITTTQLYDHALANAANGCSNAVAAAIMGKAEKKAEAASPASYMEVA